MTRACAIVLAVLALLGGCGWPDWSGGDGNANTGWRSGWSETAPATEQAPRTGWQSRPAEPSIAATTAIPSAEEMRLWEEQWARSRRALADAQAEAAAAGRNLAPEVSAEVTEVVNREVTAPDDAARLERLQRSVSDARRLAEIVGAG
ncbi:hypothetical protein DKT77_00790 [Meridianimarinicoccus roseus]|uniref:Uncharacterized protein n=1 Tax=Meridianimarinicoccus roseus TaxID=2072018 RepID=A0A2V2LMV7_9RHOB|nr:hypothetical protein [Meridianimarinicoccus roseus]PWR04536.1 hypothetical protein DKT77_00790 [Meridianimarinicoccus roseus]